MGELLPFSTISSIFKIILYLWIWGFLRFVKDNSEYEWSFSIIHGGHKAFSGGDFIGDRIHYVDYCVRTCCHRGCSLVLIRSFTNF